MKKNLLLRFSLIFMVALSAYSCRTDQFPEQEIHNNSSKFQLTSQRISLNEAKHKAQLVSEIEKAEIEIKAHSKNHAQGRSVDFGNGMIINTDNVIYMENGPNYHTYTFSIQRNNPLPEAPVENLVFTPLPEGGYKAYLVTYNFTEAEKNIIINGGNVPVNGKSFVTPLEGTFTSVMSVDNCTMQVSDYYTVCNGNLEHSNGETEAQGCTASVKSQHIVIMDFNCGGSSSPQPGIEGPGEGGNPGEGGGTSPNPCSVNGVYINPQDPDNSDCNGGVVTQPNIEINFSETPCQKIIANNIIAKAILAKTKVAAKKTEITSTISTDDKEKSFLFGVKPDGEDETTPILQGTTYASPMDATHPDFKVHGGGHTHTRDVLNVTL